jgi:predicted amidohydrolase YtcJ
VPVRYNNAKIWLGAGLGFKNSLVVSGSKVVADNDRFDSEIDCQGRVIIPAFVDAHAHPLLAGREHRGPAIGKDSSIEQIQAAVSEWMSKNPTAEWVQGGAYNRSLIASGRFEAAWLDSVSDSKAIVLHSDDHHSIWVNTQAMRLAGIDENHLDNVLGVDLDGSGRPTGVFRETDAKNLILKHAPEPLLDEDLLALEWAQSQMLAHGITGVQDAWVDGAILKAYLEGNRLGLIRIKINLAIWIQPESWRQDLKSLQANLPAINTGSGSLTGLTVKLFVDGVFGNATAAISQSYQASDLAGNTFWSPDELALACKAATLLGLQLHMHTIGDEAVEMALRAIDSLGRKATNQNAHLGNLPPVLAHVELLNDTQISRMKSLGLIANLQPLWGRPDSMMRSTAAQLGSRAAKLYRTRDLMDSGVQVTFGSDWPVSDPNPFLGLYTAVTRRLPSGSATHNAIQAVTLEQALTAYTAAAGEQLGLVDRKSLLPGCQADFLILDGDPFEDIEALPHLKVLQTISGGQTLFTRH